MSNFPENFPSVLVLIPTFNRPEYFKIALESVLNQTYQNIDIVVSDNSTNNETEELIQSYLEKNPRIKYFHHQNFDANDNWNFLRQYQINDTEHEYLNWLMDDDLFYPKKIEIMLRMFLNNPDVSLVSSKRNFIDENGNVTDQYNWLNETSKLSGEAVGKLIFLNYHNYVGEPTTALIKKSCLRNNDLCLNEDETGFFAYVDTSTWLQLLSKGNLIWINEPLSASRAHKGQVSFWANTKIRFNIEWAKLITTAWNRKMFLKTKDDIRKTVFNWFRAAVKFTLWPIYDRNYESEDLTELKRIMTKFSEALISDYYDIDYTIKSRGLSHKA